MTDSTRDVARSSRNRIVIRAASKSDGPELATLMTEMERHHEGAEAIDTAVVMERLQTHWPQGNGAQFLVAVEQGEARSAIVGFALLFRLFPGRAVEPVWWLKELYVAEAARGQGIGAALMRACAHHVDGLGGKRLDWTTATANTRARQLYERIGGVALDAVVYRLEGAALERLASEAPLQAEQVTADMDGDIDAMTWQTPHSGSMAPRVPNETCARNRWTAL
jgi:GNAT superfamily N-acetyltransferase